MLKAGLVGLALTYIIIIIMYDFVYFKILMGWAQVKKMDEVS